MSERKPASAAASPAQPEWAMLRRYTPARIAIGRTGCGVPTAAYLDFQAAHARARDAVDAELDTAALSEAISARGWPVIAAASAAGDRHAFLRRPELGRMLCAQSRARLSEPVVAPDVTIVVGDGLSSVAVERNAIPVLDALCSKLAGRALRFAPIVVATQARVALADEIGELLQAKVSVMLIGERPGLSTADSLGIYLTFAPRRGRVDSERNCISNIHAGGMAPKDAATRVIELIRRMLDHQASGVLLAACVPRLPPRPTAVGSAPRSNRECR